MTRKIRPYGFISRVLGAYIRNEIHETSLLYVCITIFKSKEPNVIFENYYPNGLKIATVLNVLNAMELIRTKYMNRFTGTLGGHFGLDFRNEDR